MNNFFDKIYCVNLDRRPDRWSECKGEIDKHNLIVERFPAVDGNPNGIKVFPGVQNGDVGCTLSHYNIIMDAKKNNLNQILVLEDDVVFHDDLNNLFEKYVKYLPDDWDMIYFGGNHQGGLIPVNEHIAKVNHTYTTHAYGIRKSVFDHVEILHGQGKKQVDVYYAEIQKIFNCYVFRPHLAWQRAGFSDIQNKYQDYSFLKG